MPARLREQRVPEARAQPVRLGVDVRLDEGAAVRPIQLHHDLTLQPAQLVDRRREGMAGRLAGRGVVAAHPDGLRAIRAEHEQAAAAEFPAEVQEKGRGGVVHPMQIVEEQDQRSLGRDRLQGAE